MKKRKDMRGRRGPRRTTFESSLEYARDKLEKCLARRESLTKELEQLNVDIPYLRTVISALDPERQPPAVVRQEKYASQAPTSASHELPIAPMLSNDEAIASLHSGIDTVLKMNPKATADGIERQLVSWAWQFGPLEDPLTEIQAILLARSRPPVPREPTAQELEERRQAEALLAAAEHDENVFLR